MLANKFIQALVILFLSSIEFSVGQKAVSDNEVGKASCGPEGLLTPIRNGDIPGFRGAINKGLLDKYFQDCLIDEKQVKVMDESMNEKMFSIERLLSFKLVFVPTDDFLKKNPKDDRIFRVNFYPGLSVPLVVNTEVIHNWNDTISKPLYTICMLPDVETRTVKYFFKEGVDINARFINDTKESWDPTVLDVAVYSKNVPLVKFLVENGSKINLTELAPIGDAISPEYHNFINIYSPDALKTNEGNVSLWSPLLTAVSFGKKDMVEYLLSAGIDVNVNGNSWLPINYALKKEKIDILKVLLQRGIDVKGRNVYGTSVLHIAADAGSLEGARLLLERGADVNAKDKFGWTPIQVAALSSKDTAMVELFLKYGAELKPTPEGFSPLVLAEASSKSWFFECLAATVAKKFPDKKPQECIEATESFTDFHHASLVVSFLNKGTNVNHQDDRLGWTALHWAAATGDFEVAKILIDNKSYTNLKSKIGMTPLDIAKYFGKAELVKYLTTFAKM